MNQLSFLFMLEFEKKRKDELWEVELKNISLQFIFKDYYNIPKHVLSDIYIYIYDIYIYYIYDIYIYIIRDMYYILSNKIFLEEERFASEITISHYVYRVIMIKMTPKWLLKVIFQSFPILMSWF